jgi:hypothetical protein
MHLLLSIVVVVGFAVVVVFGALSVAVDLLALTKHQPPSVFDELREDDQESEDWNGRDTRASRPTFSRTRTRRSSAVISAA